MDKVHFVYGQITIVQMIEFGINRYVANFGSRGENQVEAAACGRAASAWCRAARVPDRRSRSCAGACSGVAGQLS